LTRKADDVIEVWIAADRQSKRCRTVQALAAEKGLPVRHVRIDEMNARLSGLPHQGFAALARAPKYVELEGLFEKAGHTTAERLVLAADHITDEGNLGALIRAASFFGADGLVIPKDRSAGLGGRVIKNSAGSSLFLPVSRVVNLARALDILAREGFWIIGAAGEAGTSVYDFDWKRDVVLVMGREDRGITPNVRSRCHELVAIPGSGQTESLNVSVAAGVILSEIRRQTWLTRTH
jgi:23S rRNA (guanosine2251-2'-O)-methyltransferase